MAEKTTGWQNYPFAVEMYDKQDGSPRLGLVLFAVDIDAKAGPFSLTEAGNGVYYYNAINDDGMPEAGIPRGTYKLYEVGEDGEGVFTGITLDHLAGIANEENAYTETIEARLLREHKVPQSYAPECSKFTGEAIQAAIDDGVAKGVNRVFLPSGWYILKEPIVISQSNFCLDGGGAAKLAYENEESNGPMVVIEGDDVRLNGITFSALYPQQESSCVKMSGPKASIIGCRFFTGPSAAGVEFDFGSGCTVVGSFFGSQGTGIRFVNDWDGNAAIAGCSFYNQHPLFNAPSASSNKLSIAGCIGVTNRSIRSELWLPKVEGMEAQAIYFGCKRKYDGGAFQECIKTEDTTTCFMQLLRDDELQTYIADVSGIAVGGSFMFPTSSTISVSSDDYGTLYVKKLVAQLPVTNISIADGAVTTAKIADGAVTTAKIASGVLPVTVSKNMLIEVAQDYTEGVAAITGVSPFKNWILQDSIFQTDITDPTVAGYKTYMAKELHKYLGIKTAKFLYRSVRFTLSFDIYFPENYKTQQYLYAGVAGIKDADLFDEQPTIANLSYISHPQLVILKGDVNDGDWNRQKVYHQTMEWIRSVGLSDGDKMFPYFTGCRDVDPFNQSERNPMSLPKEQYSFLPDRNRKSFFWAQSHEDQPNSGSDPSLNDFNAVFNITFTAQRLDDD